MAAAPYSGDGRTMSENRTIVAARVTLPSGRQRTLRVLEVTAPLGAQA
jgi:hypothetical protein